MSGDSAGDDDAARLIKTVIVHETVFDRVYAYVKVPNTSIATCGEVGNVSGRTGNGPMPRYRRLLVHHNGEWIDDLNGTVLADDDAALALGRQVIQDR